MSPSYSKSTKGDGALTNFERLCLLIVRSNGDPSLDELVNCGYDLALYFRLRQPEVRKEKLVERARENLHEMGFIDV